MEKIVRFDEVNRRTEVIDEPKTFEEAARGIGEAVQIHFEKQYALWISKQSRKIRKKIEKAFKEDCYNCSVNMGIITVSYNWETIISMDLNEFLKMR